MKLILSIFHKPATITFYHLGTALQILKARSILFPQRSALSRMADPNDSPNFFRVDPSPEEWASLHRDSPRSGPPKPTAPLKKKFEILLNKYIESRAEKGMDDSTAIDDLFQNLGSVQQARKFFSETAEYFKDTAPVGCDITDFKRRLKTANWTTGGEDLGFVYLAFRLFRALFSPCCMLSNGKNTSAT
jgi:hypothetical protein